MISPRYVDGLEQRIKELTHERDELSAQLKTSRRDYEVMNKFREGAESERNALAAHVERFNELYRRATEEDAGWMTNSHVVKEYAAICRDIPETSLARLKAQWQAEVLEALANSLTLGGDGNIIDKKGIKERAAEVVARPEVMHD